MMEKFKSPLVYFFPFNIVLWSSRTHMHNSRLDLIDFTKVLIKSYFIVFHSSKSALFSARRIQKGIQCFESWHPKPLTNAQSCSSQVNKATNPSE